MRSPANTTPSVTETFSATEGCQLVYHHLTTEPSGRRIENGAEVRWTQWDIVEEITGVQGEAKK